MATKIFGVDYLITEMVNGKNPDTLKESKSVVAKDALDAILKVKKEAEKPYSFKSDEDGKIYKVTKKDFNPTHVALRAQTD